LSSYSAGDLPKGAIAPRDWPHSEVVDALYDVLRAMPELRAALAHRLGLNPSEVDAMEHIMGEPMGPTELARRLYMTSASSTVLVDRLVQAGHATREFDPSDGRRRLVRPTPKGAGAVFAQIGPLVADLVEAEDGLTRKERVTVTNYLRRVLEVLEEHTEGQ
jgi:DNA-binding MarR family transcriptional regulator